MAYLEDGTTVSYRRMVSTMPLRDLPLRLMPPDQSSCVLTKPLESLDLLLIDVGVKHPVDSDVHWVYFPDPDVMAYRLHCCHTLSPRLAPPGHGLYCLEVTYSRHRPLPPAPLRDRIVDDLVRTGWIARPSDVAFYRERRFPCAYILPRVGHKAVSAVACDRLAEFDIVSVGRYGEWTYSNMEDALLSGERAVAVAASR